MLLGVAQVIQIVLLNISMAKQLRIESEGLRCSKGNSHTGTKKIQDTGRFVEGKKDLPRIEGIVGTE
jgi:hypothetical protein